MRVLWRIIRLVKADDRRGIALVYVALLLIALFAIIALAIDIGYMYVAKTELQNASDAASLAGATKLKSIGNGISNPEDMTQTAARNEAISFAQKNTAAKQNVVIVTDNSNLLSDNNDITVGRWNTAFRSYSANKAPVNAIQVRARRTEQSPGGNISTFFGKVLGIHSLGVSADSISALPMRATALIAICIDSCTNISTNPQNPTILSPPRILERNPTAAGNLQFAWTSLLIKTTSTPEITKLICSENPNEEVCYKNIYTTQGTSSDAFKDLEAVFNDPNFDRDNKEFSGSQVTGWWVIVPVTQTCPVTAQGIGNGTEPKTVSHYALIRIISACDKGGGQACRPYSTPNCKNEYAHKIVIDRIACINCADISNESGLKPVLVR